MMNIAKVAHIIQTDVKNFGVLRAVYDLSYRATNRMVDAKILRCMMIDAIDPLHLNFNGKYVCKFLEVSEALEMAADSECLLPRDFLLEAFNKGDQCFG